MVNNSKMILIMIIALAGLLLWVSPAQAQEPTPTEESDANCVACHEHQYYVYDSGKWYCLCEAPMHCVYCHGGRTDSDVEEIAHEGLVLYPTHEHAERCQTCHTEDYMARVVAFESMVGVSPTIVPIITATPVEPAAPVEATPSNPLLVRLGQLNAWQLVGLVFLGILAIGIAIFGYRCWKADCLTKQRS